MKPRHLILGAALLAAACLAAWGGRDEPAAVIEGTRGQTATGSRTTAELPLSVPGTQANAAEMVLELVPRERLIGHAQPDAARGLFAARSWAPPAQVAGAPSEPVAPTAPALPFTYLGKEQSGSAWRVFLVNGDATLVVGETDSIDDQYKVVSITPPTMTFEYLPLRERQTLQIE